MPIYSDPVTSMTPQQDTRNLSMQEKLEEWRRNKAERAANASKKNGNVNVKKNGMVKKKKKTSAKSSSENSAYGAGTSIKKSKIQQTLSQQSFLTSKKTEKSNTIKGTKARIPLLDTTNATADRKDNSSSQKDFVFTKEKTYSYSKGQVMKKKKHGINTQNRSSNTSSASSRSVSPIADARSTARSLLPDQDSCDECAERALHLLPRSPVELETDTEKEDGRPWLPPGRPQPTSPTKSSVPVVAEAFLVDANAPASIDQGVDSIPTRMDLNLGKEERSDSSVKDDAVWVEDESFEASLWAEFSANEEVKGVDDSNGDATWIEDEASDGILFNEFYAAQKDVISDQDSSESAHTGKEFPEQTFPNDPALQNRMEHISKFIGEHYMSLSCLESEEDIEKAMDHVRVIDWHFKEMLAYVKQNYIQQDPAVDNLIRSFEEKDTFAEKSDEDKREDPFLVSGGVETEEEISTRDEEMKQRQDFESSAMSYAALYETMKQENISLKRQLNELLQDGKESSQFRKKLKQQNQLADEEKSPLPIPTSIMASIGTSMTPVKTTSTSSMCSPPAMTPIMARLRDTPNSAIASPAASKQARNRRGNPENDIITPKTRRIQQAQDVNDHLAFCNDYMYQQMKQNALLYVRERDRLTKVNDNLVRRHQDEIRYWKATQQQRIEQLAKTLKTSLEASANKCLRMQNSLQQEKEAHAMTIKRMQARLNHLQHQQNATTHRRQQDEDGDGETDVSDGSYSDDEDEFAHSGISDDEDEETVESEEMPDHHEA